MESMPVPKPRTQTGTCEVDECERPKKSRGMCAKHYLSDYLKKNPGKNMGATRGHPLYTMWWERKERGSLCEAWATDFWAFVAGVGERPSKTHLLRPLRYGEPYGPDNFEWLAALKREAGETLKVFNARKWQSRRERFPEYEGHRSMKRKYGITPEQYQAMYKAQEGLCGICRQSETQLHPKTHAPKALAVDHCHDFGHVRELLCSRCNTTLGKVDHSIPMLTAMIEYLKRHEPGVI